MRNHRISWLAMSFTSLVMFPASNEARSQAPRGHFTDVRNVGSPVNSYGPIAPSISADGLSLYFGSSRGGNRDLYQATRPTVNDAFTDVINLGSGINGPAADRAPVISSDGLTLYFSSTRAGGLGSDDIYQATRRTVNDPFGDVMNLGTVNTTYDDRPEHVSPDGKTLYFESTRPGGEGRFDLYMANRENLSDPFTDVVNLGSRINSPTSDFGATVSSDGLTMFFSDRLEPFRPSGQGAGDIWVAVRSSTDEQFGNVVNLDSFSLGSDINGRLHDALPSISSDWPAAGSQLYLNANALSGPYNIWQATWVPETPADLNGDGVLTGKDIDMLSAEISAGTNNPVIDLTGDDTVDDADLLRWRTDAATHNGFTQAYLLGDSDLDGVVDSADLNNLALNWRQGDSVWSGGDFTADGVVDSADLNALALNWRQSIPMASAVSAPVPEPSALLLTLVGLASVWMRARRR